MVERVDERLERIYAERHLRPLRDLAAEDGVPLTTMRRWCTNGGVELFTIAGFRKLLFVNPDQLEQVREPRRVS